MWRKACVSLVVMILALMAAVLPTPLAGEAMAAGPTATVSMLAVSFGPAEVTVFAGTTVTWSNSGPGIHTSTSDAGQWDSNVVSGGQNFSHTFTTSGVYPYHCTFHQLFGIVGTIRVIDPSSQTHLPLLARNDVSGW